MSVTFEATLGEVSAFGLTCGHENGVTEHRWGNYADAAEFLQKELDEHGNTGHLAVCGDEDCRYQRMFTHPILTDPSPQVNVSGGKAVYLLGLLGIEVDEGEHPSGAMSAHDFLGRVLVAQAINPADAGRPATESGMLVVNCGRSKGYDDRRLAQLREVGSSASTGAATSGGPELREASVAVHGTRPEGGLCHARKRTAPTVFV